MPLFRRVIDRKINNAADEIVDQLVDGEGDKPEHGSAIITWILSQIIILVVKKILERILDSDRPSEEEIKGLISSIDSSRGFLSRGDE